MKNQGILLKSLLSFLFILYFNNNKIIAGEGLNLYTPFTKVVVPPGEVVDYEIEVINNGNSIKKIDLSISGLPKTWVYTLKAGGYDIKQISVLPKEKKTITLKVEVPLEVNKGNHWFNVVARNHDVLPLTIKVSEKGTYKTEFTSDQINMQGHSGSNFNFTTKLKNLTAEKQVYSLFASAPRGWSVIFKPNYKQATAVEITPNGTSNIQVEIKPPFNIKSGTYKIPIKASNRSTSANLELEVVISGTYDIELTTPTGLLSTNLTAGSDKRVELLVKNTGSSDLNNIIFKSSKPKNWDVSFKPDTLTHLKAGGKATVYATIEADEKAIPGDYLTNITAETKESLAKASFRVSVKTSLLWGWLGVFIVAGTSGAIYYLFRKYGRR